MNKRMFWAAIALFILVEAALMIWVDLPLSLYLREIDRTQPGLINLFRHFTNLGKSVWYLWPLGVGCLVCSQGLRVKSLPPLWYPRLAQTGRRLFFAFLTIGTSGLLVDALKPIIGRGRPVTYQRETLYGFHMIDFQNNWNSLPSGHASTAFALAAVLTLYWPRGKILWLSLALVLTVSRVMVNAHYLADLLAGAVIGWFAVQFWRRRMNTRGMNNIMQGLFPIDMGTVLS